MENIMIKNKIISNNSNFQPSKLIKMPIKVREISLNNKHPFLMIFKTVQ